MSNKKEKEIIDLCFKYNKGCKWCPRYKKCLNELKLEDKKMNLHKKSH